MKDFQQTSFVERGGGGKKATHTHTIPSALVISLMPYDLLRVRSPLFSSVIILSNNVHQLVSSLGPGRQRKPCLFITVSHRNEIIIIV